jgi:recombination associated protein RdgC
MIRNAIIYQVTPGFRFDAGLIGRDPIKPCGPFEIASRGFAKVRDADATLIHVVAGMQVICLEVEQKIMPAAAVREVAGKRIAEIEETDGRKVGRKEARDIKERTVEEMLPKAFTMRRRTYAVLAGRYFIIDAGSQAKADEFVEMLIKAHDNVAIRPLQTSLSPVVAMTDWIARGDAPAGFSIDADLELRSSAEAVARIKYVHHALAGPEIAEHIAAGKIATKLGMTRSDRVSFVLTDKLHIKRLAFLDVLKEQAEEQAETAADQFDADVTIMVGETVKLIDDMVESLGGIVKPDDDLLKAA